MVGILISKLFPSSHVVITDLEEYVPLIQHNIEVNGVNDRSSDCCTTSSFDWFKPPDIGKFDVICAFEW
jgi:methylase of polypeptide subunit release factors